jgi:DNA-binding MarR family transcriptional regulator
MKMDAELRSMIDLFLKILQAYTEIDKKPKDYGTGDKLYVREIHTIALIGHHPEINPTQLAERSGVTRGAISQIMKRLISKRYIARYKVRNHKEVNLRLSDRGYQVFLAHEAFEKERFAFAERLYNEASQPERDLVKRLFHDIYANISQLRETAVDFKMFNTDN